jgi:hypothetical protein
LCLACVFGAAETLFSADAVQEERREFKIYVDGKERGSFRMRVREHADGSEVMSGEAEIALNFVVYSYRYNSRGWEKWKDGRVQQLENVADYNGKRYTVKAVAHENVLKVNANGQDRSLPPEAWLTSYWRLPAAKYRNRALPLLDSDKGRDLRAELKFLGTQPLNVEGSMQNCDHYRVSGDVQVELWYDSQDRMVRQESVESGHQTSLILTRIDR